MIDEQHRESLLHVVERSIAGERLGVRVGESPYGLPGQVAHSVLNQVARPMLAAARVGYR